mgnify:CR=1 FL=1
MVKERTRVPVEGGTITGAVIGGRAAAGAATKNIAVLKAGCPLGTSAQPITITGGLAENGAASGNTIDVMSGAVIHGNLIGGDGTTATNDNTVILENATVNGTIIGGTRPNAAGNTLIVDGGGTTAKQLSNLQSLQFIIPESMTAAQAAANPLLQLTSTTQDITGMKIGVQVAGNASPLQKGDEVSLMKVAAGGTITSAAHLQNEVTVKQGVARRYKFSLQKTAANDEIRATVDGISVSEKSKSLVETRAAASALINSSADLLTDAGFAAAGAVAAKAGGSFDAWAVQTGSSMRLHSGSYIDTKGYGLNVGFVRKNALKDGALTFGPFGEYGRGSYDSYLDDGTHGDGTISYIGAGLMAKLSQTSGGYIEGSLRAGRAKSDYKGMLDGDVSNYDSANAYYAAHLGFGHVFKLHIPNLEIAGRHAVRERQHGIACRHGADEELQLAKVPDVPRNGLPLDHEGVAVRIVIVDVDRAADGHGRRGGGVDRDGVASRKNDVRRGEVCKTGVDVARNRTARERDLVPRRIARRRVASIDIAREQDAADAELVVLRIAARDMRAVNVARNDGQRARARVADRDLVMAAAARFRRAVHAASVRGIRRGDRDRMRSLD